jgi:acyl-CoA reductase-like NAD-dependent aldehyde dehydrogenase
MDQYLPRTNYAVPFGGVRQSGLGRENGAAAVDESTEVKSVWIDSGSVSPIRSIRVRERRQAR